MILMIISYTFLVVIAIIVGVKWYSFRPSKEKKKAIKYEKIRKYSYKEFLNKSKSFNFDNHKPVALQVRFYLKKKGLELEFYIYGLKKNFCGIWNKVYIKDFYHNNISTDWLNRNYYLYLVFLLSYVRSCTYDDLHRVADSRIDLLDKKIDLGELSLFVKHYIMALYDNRDAMENVIVNTYNSNFLDRILCTPRSMPYITQLELKFYFKSVRDDISKREDIEAIKHFIDHL